MPPDTTLDTAATPLPFDFADVDDLHEGAVWLGLDAPGDEQTIDRLEHAFVRREQWNAALPAARSTAHAALELIANMQCALRDLFGSDPDVAAMADDYLRRLARAEPSVRTLNGYIRSLDSEAMVRRARRAKGALVLVLKEAKGRWRTGRRPRLSEKAWLDATNAQVVSIVEEHCGPVEGDCDGDLRLLLAGEKPGVVAARILGKLTGVGSDRLLRTPRESEARP